MFQRYRLSAAFFTSAGKVRPGPMGAIPALPRRRGKTVPPAFPFAVMIAWIAVGLCCRDAAADPRLLRGPGAMVPPKSSASGHPPPGVLAEIASAPVLFYQRFLGPHWGNRCPSYPSCSQYALLAIRKHGALIGTMLVFDRLQHEAGEGRTSPRIRVRGEMKLFDPLENNDFWWYKSGNFEPAGESAGKRGPGHDP